MIEPINSEDPMSTLYKIGDVGKLLGITPESIRHYEEHDIVTPTKTRCGYRYFMVWDIRALTRARMYRKLGFSLTESAQLLNKKSTPEIISSLAENEANIEKKITWYMNLLKFSRDLRDIMKEAESSTNKYRIEQRPPLYRIDLLKYYQLSFNQEKQDLYRSWSSKSPFVSPSALFPKHLLEKEEFDVSYGLVIGEEYADLMRINQSKDVAYLPSCPCVYTTMLTNSKMVLTYEDFVPVMQYLKGQGFKLSGDVVGRVVLTKREKDTYYSWHQIWLPFE